MPPSAASQPQIASDTEKEKYVAILKSNGISDQVERVSMFEPEELKGEHMATASVYVCVEFKDPSKRPKNLFVKKFTDGEVFKNLVKKMRIMEKESTFFLEFLPQARDFCKRFPNCANAMDFFPKCLYGNDETVVLENVVLDDTFVMLPKADLQDLYTAKFVLGNLAKLHAVTAAMIEESGRDKFREKNELLISEVCFSDKNPFVAQMLEGAIDTCINIMKENPCEGSSVAIETLRGYTGRVTGELEDLLRYDENEKLQVINHGDCWNNNMLFKKDSETGKVNEHIFIDLQVTRMGSPNLDLGYYLYTSVKSAVRRNHLEELLQHYFKLFKATLESLNQACPVTYEEFFEDYKKKNLMGFFFGLNFICIIGAIKDVDLSDMSEDPDHMMDAYTDAINNWIKNNPVKSLEISTEIVARLKEYQNLTG